MVWSIEILINGHLDICCDTGCQLFHKDDKQKEKDDTVQGERSNSELFWSYMEIYLDYFLLKMNERCTDNMDKIYITIFVLILVDTI